MSEREEEWVSISAIGDSWEVEMNIHEPLERLKYRYRSAMLGNVRTDWSYGRPPTGVHARAANA